MSTLRNLFFGNFLSIAKNWIWQYQAECDGKKQVPQCRHMLFCAINPICTDYISWFWIDPLYIYWYGIHEFRECRCRFSLLKPPLKPIQKASSIKWRLFILYRICFIKSTHSWGWHLNLINENQAAAGFRTSCRRKEANIEYETGTDRYPLS